MIEINMTFVFVFFDVGENDVTWFLKTEEGRTTGFHSSYIW